MRATFPVLLLASTAWAASWTDLLAQLKSLNTSSPSGPITPEIIANIIAPIKVDIARNSPITRHGSELQLQGQRWTASGANVYWLGLDENVAEVPGQPFYAPYNASYPTKERITEVMYTLQTMGARTIRSQTLGVSVGNPLSIWPTLNQTNEEAFDTLDWTVYQAREHGLRIFAPLTDNYDYYHGGKYVFLRWRGFNITQQSGTQSPDVQQFYTNPEVVADFKAYIRTLLLHVNPYTGLSYAQDPTIFAYESGNELGGPVFGDKNVPATWTEEIGKFIKELAPHKLYVDGTYGVNATHLNLASVDIFSDHFYPADVSKLKAGVAQVESVSKVYFAAEYDWIGNNPQASSLDDFFGVIEAAQNSTKPVIGGDHFWSLFQHNAPDCTTYVNHNDGFSLQYGNPANSAQINTQIAKIRQHFFRMKGQEVDGAVNRLPIAACPGAPTEGTYS